MSICSATVGKVPVVTIPLQTEASSCGRGLLSRIFHKVWLNNNHASDFRERIVGNFALALGLREYYPHQGQLNAIQSGPELPGLGRSCDLHMVQVWSGTFRFLAVTFGPVCVTSTVRIEAYQREPGYSVCALIASAPCTSKEEATKSPDG